MRRLLCSLLFLLFAVHVAFSEEAEWLWPIIGQQAGEGIIAQPGDKIGHSRVRNSLYIAASEGTPVVCPADALVKYCVLHYQKTAKFSYAFSFDKPFEDVLADNDDELKKLSIDPHYVSAALTLAVDEREIHFTGFRCDTAFEPGTMLHRGDTIGTVAYAYHRLQQPCISLSTNMYSLSYDPMSPFGLESTFKRPHYWRTGERQAVIAVAVVLTALLIWLVFHLIYKIKDRRRRVYFDELMGRVEEKANESIDQQVNAFADQQSFPVRLAACQREFEATASARVLMEAAADDNRTLTSDERRAILADISRIFADVMLDVKRSSMKVNAQELLLCILSALHVPRSVMADCLNVGLSTIRTRKTRLKEKMPEELFTLFFSAL